MVSKMDRILLSGLVRAQSWWRSQKGAVGFEYMLVVGGVSVAIVLAIAVGAPGLIATIKTKVCSAIGTIPGFSGTSC